MSLSFQAKTRVCVGQEVDIVAGPEDLVEPRAEALGVEIGFHVIRRRPEQAEDQRQGVGGSSGTGSPPRRVPLRPSQGPCSVSSRDTAGQFAARNRSILSGATV